MFGSDFFVLIAVGLILVSNCVVSIALLQVRKYKSMILEDLESALAEHAPPGGGDLSSELPPLTIDGIPVSVDKMTQVAETSRWRCRPVPTVPMAHLTHLSLV